MLQEFVDIIQISIVGWYNEVWWIHVSIWWTLVGMSLDRILDLYSLSNGRLNSLNTIFFCLHFVCVCSHWPLTCLSTAVPCGVGWPVLLTPSNTPPFICWQGEHRGVWLIIETSLSSEFLSHELIPLPRKLSLIVCMHFSVNEKPWHCHFALCNGAAWHRLHLDMRNVQAKGHVRLILHFCSHEF